MKTARVIILALMIFSIGLNAQTIWVGTDINFSKGSNTDWSVEANQDRLTNTIWLTRQNRRPLYNYKWWQDTFNTDATQDDLFFDFWNVDSGTPSQTFTPTGGTKGLKWCILDDTGSTTDWSGFSFYGTLGSPTNFTSFKNVTSLIKLLEEGNTVSSIDDNFTINGNPQAVDMNFLIGKNLGVWLEDDDIYLSLSFTNWGTGTSGGAVAYSRSSDSSVLSVDEVTSNSELKVFPNPTNDVITISGITNSQNYAVFNSVGSKIKEGHIYNDHAINLSPIKNGFYIIQLENGQSFKIIKH